MLRRVAFVRRTSVPEKHVASIIGVEIISELGATSAVTLQDCEVDMTSHSFTPLQMWAADRVLTPTQYKLQSNIRVEVFMAMTMKNAVS
jgi:hypothetical protein